MHLLKLDKGDSSEDWPTKNTFSYKAVSTVWKGQKPEYRGRGGFRGDRGSPRGSYRGRGSSYRGTSEVVYRGSDRFRGSGRGRGSYRPVEDEEVPQVGNYKGFNFDPNYKAGRGQSRGSSRGFARGSSYSDRGSSYSDRGSSYSDRGASSYNPRGTTEKYMTKSYAGSNYQGNNFDPNFKEKKVAREGGSGSYRGSSSSYRGTSYREATW